MKILPVKQSLLIALSVSIFSSVHSQDQKLVTQNTLDPELSGLQRSAYMYASFQDGKVIFKDGGVVEAKLNYNNNSGQILFIAPKGDTLALAHAELTSFVAIGLDTLAFFEKAFLKKLTHYTGSPNLYAKQTLKFIGKEKKGAYGTYSPTTAVNSNSTFSPDDQITTYISPDENLLYQTNTFLFLSDAFGNFFPCNKSRFYGLFNANEKDLKTFADANKTNFKKQEDLLKILAYAVSLK